MKLIRYKEGDKSTLGKFKELYNAAFPKEERKPFKLIEGMHRKGIVDMLKIEGNSGEFLGLAFTVKGDGLVLLDYFAVSEEYRCKGHGRAALELIKELYKGRPLLIEIEDPDAPSPNKSDRLRRLSFYRECQMEINPFCITLFGVDMITLSYGGPVSFEDYKNLYYTIVPKKTVDKNVILR